MAFKINQGTGTIDYSDPTNTTPQAPTTQPIGGIKISSAAGPGTFTGNSSAPIQKAPTKEDLAAEALNQTANDYEKNLPGYKDYLQNIYADQSRRNLAEKQTSIKRNANSRGLIGSGIQQGNAARASADSQRDLATQKLSINNMLDAKLDSIRQAASATALGIAAPINLNDYAVSGMESQLRKELADQAATEKLYSTIGSVGSQAFRTGVNSYNSK